MQPSLQILFLIIVYRVIIVNHSSDDYEVSPRRARIAKIKKGEDYIHALLKVYKIKKTVER